MAQANTGGRGASDGSKATRKSKKKTPIYVVIARVFGWMILTLFTLCVIGVLTAGIFFKIFMTYVDTTLIPSLSQKQISTEELTLSLASTIYDRNGTPILTLFDNSNKSGGNRELIEYDDLPEHLINALVAIEDKRFWTHQGVDWYGTLGAIRSTVTGGATRGGSTLTQQVLRNMYDDKEVTVQRKLREIFRALEFERDPNVTKEYIITEYLNRVFFGQSYYGIQTAAKGYFGKDVSELSLAESAAIIGITNNPSLYDPFRNARFLQSDGTYKTCREFNKSRQELILDQMCEQEMISEAVRDAAKAEKLIFTDTDEYKAAHGLTKDPVDGEDGEDGEAEETSAASYTWFEDAAIEEAIRLIQEERGVGRETASLALYNAGYHIYTTLDPDIQAIVDEVYEDPSNFPYPSPTGAQLDSAIAVVDPYTGDVMAMAGGVGVKTGRRSLNLATSPRNPGSAIKPVAVYSPALEYDVASPGSVIDDYPLSINAAKGTGYPKNDSGHYDGYRTLANGLQHSINTVASRTLEALGYSRSFEFLEQHLGFTTLDPQDLTLSSLALGGMTYGVTTVEMAAAYGAFANEGIYTYPRMITEIRANDNVTVVVDNASRSQTAMKKTTAYEMNRMLRSVVTGGTGSSYNLSGMTCAGKTGTTSNKYDRYFCGYTPYYAAAVWTGYAKKAELINSPSVNPAGAVWKKVMSRIHEGLEDKGFFSMPDGIRTIQVCADCGKLPVALCAADYRGSRVISVEVQSSGAPTENCTCHVEVRVCTNPLTGDVRLAGNHCPEETTQTRIMLAGRKFLGLGGEAELPDGTSYAVNPIPSGDMMAHLTYFRTLGTCTYHDENFDPEAELPPEEDIPNEPGGPGNPSLPGDTNWPSEPFNPNTGTNNTPGTGNTTNPGTTEPADPGTTEVSGGGQNSEPSPQQPEEPDEPALPDEPDLP